jgi:hypothetical protein
VAPAPLLPVAGVAVVAAVVWEEGSLVRFQGVRKRGIHGSGFSFCYDGALSGGL